MVERSYLEPYTVKAMKYLVPALHDFGEIAGHILAPTELYAAACKSLRFVGYQGMATTAVSGLDIAAWEPAGPKRHSDRNAALTSESFIGVIDPTLQGLRVQAGASGPGWPARSCGRRRVELPSLLR